ncbi:MAG: alanyl-tRNA editing protein AlaX, partial [Candidatus Aenigmatarchaeota archaeon]
FYPRSGGQAWDTGRMVRESDGRGFNVVFVGKFSGNISHEVEPDCQGDELKAGDRVRCILDWDRRYKLMKSHTAAHIISEVINRETGAMITGNQLEPDRCRIDFSVPEFDRDKLRGYEEKSNDVVNRGIDITLETMSRDDAAKDHSMTKLAKGLEALPSDIKELRIVRIGDFDVQADGGTHVKNTKEVGRIRFTDFVNKGKNNRRIYFVVE